MKINLSGPNQVDAEFEIGDMIALIDSSMRIVFASRELGPAMTMQWVIPRPGTYTWAYIRPDGQLGIYGRFETMDTNTLFSFVTTTEEEILRLIVDGNHVKLLNMINRVADLPRQWEEADYYYWSPCADDLRRALRVEE